jgi:hypothetical protein
MDATTKTEVEKILERGWYTKSQTLGHGGWAAVNQVAHNNWRNYRILLSKDVEMPIVAKDDETAINAFKILFDLSRAEYKIVEEIITYKDVAGCVSLVPAR